MSVRADVRRPGMVPLPVAAASALGLLALAGPVFSVLLSCSPHDLARAFLDREVLSAIGMSFLTATATALISLVLGVPLAYALSRSGGRLRSAVESVLAIPVLLPHTAAGIAVLSFFGPRSPFRPLMAFLLDRALGIIAAQTFVSAPLLVFSARAAFDEVPVELELVARSLGASRTKAFLWVSLPLAKEGILAGFLMAWARALSEFGAVVVIAYHPETAPVLVYRRFLISGLRGSQPVVVLLILLTACILALASAFGMRPYGGARRA